MKRDRSLAWLLWIAWLLWELRVFSWLHPVERQLLRVHLQLPVYETLLCLFAFATVVRLTARLAPLPQFVFSGRFFALHLALGGLIHVLVEPIFQAGAWIGLPVALVYLLSWLICALPPGQLGGAFKQHGPWLTGVVVLALVASRTRKAIWSQLSDLTLYCSRVLLGIFEENVICDYEQYVLGTPVFSIKVGQPCSGIQGVLLLFLVLSIYFWLRKEERSPSALIVFGVAAVASLVMNFFRIVLLIMVGIHLSPDIALNAFHSNAGWIAFLALTGIFVVGLERKLWSDETSESERIQYPAAPFILPFLVFVASNLVCAAFAESFDFLYPFKTVLLLFVLFEFKNAYGFLLERPSLATWVLGGLVYVIWIILIPTEEAQAPSHFLASGLELGWILFRLAGSVLVVPVVEELAFRGYLLRRLQSPTFEEVPVGQLTPLSLCLSSLAFGILHQAWLAATIAGLAYALAGRLRGSLQDCVVAHAVTNFLIGAHVLAMGRWDLWF